MKIKNYVALVTLLAGAALCGSCDKEGLDGVWDPVQFSVNDRQCAKTKKGKLTYDVSAEGGTYVIASTNYGGLFWLGGVTEDDKRVWEGFYEQDITDNLEGTELHVPGSWYDVAFNPFRHFITVVVQPKTEGEAARSLTFDIWCGDTGADFVLRQQ